MCHLSHPVVCRNLCEINFIKRHPSSINKWFTRQGLDRTEVRNAVMQRFIATKRLQDGYIGPLIHSSKSSGI